MSLLNTLLGSSKKLRELPAELHYGCIFPQFITSQNTGVPQTVCPRAVLPVRTKSQLPKERSFPRGQGREGIITANTEAVAPSTQCPGSAPSHKPSLLLPDPIMSHCCFPWSLFQQGFRVVQSLASLLFQFPLCRLVPTARGAG